MINITFLGTTGAAPTKERSLPSVAMVHEGDIFLFDCGEGTQMQMLKFGISTQRLKAIFLSHAHGDHIIGIAGLIRTLALNNRKDELQIFVPKGSEPAIRSLVVFDKAILNYPVRIVGIGTGKVYEGKGYAVSAFKLTHNISTLGYVFKEDDRLKFDKEKCKRLGLKGTMFAELLAKGSISAKGKRVTLKSVTSLQHGKKVVYATDTRPSVETVHNAQGADLLIHESSFGSEQKKLALLRKHSMATEAAEIAKKAKVKNLILTHFSARYRDTTPLVKEARAIFKNTTAATDGYKISI